MSYRELKAEMGEGGLGGFWLKPFWGWCPKSLVQAKVPTSQCQPDDRLSFTKTRESGRGIAGALVRGNFGRGTVPHYLVLLPHGHTNNSPFVKWAAMNEELIPRIELGQEICECQIGPEISVSSLNAATPAFWHDYKLIIPGICIRPIVENTVDWTMGNSTGTELH